MAGITMFRGKDAEIEIHFLEDNVAKNLTGATKFTVEFFSGYTDTTAAYDWDSVAEAASFDITDVATGVVVFTLTAAQTTAVAAGEYWIVVSVTTADYPTGLPWQVTKFDHTVLFY